MVTQIADGETGGVMMNEFPPKYIEVVRECSGSETPLVNVTEYLEQLVARGVRDADLPLFQPVFQMRIWERFKPGDGAEKLANVIEQLHKEDSRFNVEGGSWTNNISWVRGYERLLAPMEELSSLFYEKVLKSGVPTSEARYRKAFVPPPGLPDQLLPLLGRWHFLHYGREICRRGTDILAHDF